MVHIVPELREKVGFRRLNFMDRDFGLREQLTSSFAATSSSISTVRPRRSPLPSRFHRHIENRAPSSSWGTPRRWSGPRRPPDPASFRPSTEGCDDSRCGPGPGPLLVLKPGDMVVSRRAAMLVTTLGSCVGVTFCSSRLGGGDLPWRTAHLPASRGSGLQDSERAPLRRVQHP